MSVLNAVKNSKSFKRFLGKEVTENDRFHGSDNFKTLVFKSMDQKGITFTRDTITTIFLWEWVNISFNVKNRSFLLTLKQNTKYSILFV